MTETSQTREDVERLVARIAKEAAEEIEAHRDWLSENPDEQDPDMDDVSLSPHEALRLIAALSEAEERIKTLNADLMSRGDALVELSKCAVRVTAERDTALARIAELERPETPQEYTARMTPIDTDAIRGDLEDGSDLDGATAFALVQAYEDLLARIAGMGEDKERAAFEEWYCANAQSEARLSFWPSEIAALRCGDTYGDRPNLTGKWEGWKARASATPAAALARAEALDFRAIALAALERQRQSGESKEMAARWIAEDIRAALSPAPTVKGA